jgi:hypothetical protein
LNAARELAGWQAEVRTVDGQDELIVFVAAAPGATIEPRLRAIDEEYEVTQFVVLDADALAKRLAAAGDVRIVDQRPDGRDGKQRDEAPRAVG